MTDGFKIGDENELTLELSIGGIFEKSNQNANKSVENNNRIEDSNVQSKGQIQALRRRESRRNPEEKMKKPVDFGSFSGPFVEDIIQQNDEVLEIEPARKKEKIGNSPENIDGVVANDDSISNSQADKQMASASATPTRVADACDQPAGSVKQTVTEPGQVNSHGSVSNPVETKQSSVLGRMPCVSTTGNRPNGKTVSGFLYRYTKSEVSIVCVCHGESFSPAGFVEHAGGVDILHPLKHITIFPNAFES